MKRHFLKYFIFLVSLTLVTNLSFGNDSTLYKKRVSKIKTFAEWLNAKPDCYIKRFDSDTVVCWKLYDTAINLFLDKKVINLNFNLKAVIYSFDYLLRTFPIDSFILQMPKPSLDTLLKSGDYSSYFNNTIIFYLPMYGEKYEGLYFGFSPNSDRLIYLIEAGGSKEEYKAKKAFLNNL